jgi:glutathione synthase/RimK-type ligase-like ATP-grasp enzyme
MILLSTNERDLTSDYIVLELRRRGLPFFRLNSECLPEASITFDPEKGIDSWIVATDKQTIIFSDIKAAYFRRPGNPEVNRYANNSAAKRYCESEWGSVLTFALNSLGERWLNSPLAIMAAENKPRQLALACKIGFSIPNTLITNDFDKVQSFLKKEVVVAKPLREALIESDDSEKVIFTSRIENITEADKLGVETVPVIYQNEILKEADIRVTVIGNQVYAVKILSQEHVDTKTDWRRGSRIDLPHHIHELPPQIHEKCITLVQELGLRFGAIDLILDKVGQYWFLEVNPNGQWAWIQNRTRLPLTQAIVDELEKIASC